MTREVNLLLSLAEGTVVHLNLCNKYAVPFYNTTKELTVGAGGEVTVVLTVNDEDTCWKVQELAHTGVFWVYGEDGVQSVDLSIKQYPRNSIPTLLHADEETQALNAHAIMQKIVCDAPIVSEEEKRTWCRYEEYLVGEDETMCKIDTTMTKYAGVEYG